VELTMTGDPIAAILDQLAKHAERIIQLDAQAAGCAGASARVAELAALAQRLDQRVTDLAARLDQAAPHDAAGHGTAGQPYAPAPGRRWWKLSGPDREQAVAALRAWVDQVYRPGYGQLAAALGPCWDQHALCLYALDILAELWSVLYLTSQRSPAVLSMQAEYQARILPALAEQMTTETTRCRHGRERLPARPQPQATP
jgi:hypothetical protein